MKVLVIGGCGFIGSHLVDRLIEKGHKVRVYDLLEEQVHQGRKPDYLNKEAEYIFADVRDKDKLKKSLKNIEIVFHQASQVGVGQSMYEIEKYVSHNCLGTAVLLDLLININHKVQKLILASSMSIYGEGAYNCKKCGKIYPDLRKDIQLKKRKWEMYCAKCGSEVTPIPTSEDKPLSPTSVYATTKRTQEEMCLQIARAYNIPMVALRYFNVYGPRQSLNNPYTGVIAIFLARVKNNRPPLIFEDGLQSRDFIYVSDIVKANILAMENKNADYDFFNVGTAQSKTIFEVANTIINLGNKKISPKIVNKFRHGDIRHCYADITKIKKKLRFLPEVSFEEGIKRLLKWSKEKDAKDLTYKAQRELEKRKLTL